jgi:DNA repair exonuclease SbcCD ATPase subunit
MATPPLPQLETGNDPSPSPSAAVPSVRTGYLKCDFCECKLTQTGEVYNVSEKARGFRDQNEKHVKELAQRDEEITRLRQEISAKDAEIAALRGSATPPSTQNFI